MPVPESAKPHVTAIAYGADALEEAAVTDLATLPDIVARAAVTWIDVIGFGDVETIRTIGRQFKLHELALEDVLSMNQRPKVDDYDQHLFIVCHMPTDDPGFETVQLGLFVGERFVITFRDRAGDCFGPVRERLRRGRGRLRRSGPDYLAYALIDAVVDAYFPVLERKGEEVDTIEQAVLARSGMRVVGSLHGIKRDLLALRRAVWPHRDLLAVLTRDDSPLIRDDTRPFLRDTYDHTIQLMDMVETYREIGADLIDIHLSGVSARMNEIMKVLTVIATVFIPLNFFASLYGMNFDPKASPYNMPELELYYGYPLALAGMIALALLMVLYFWRKGWFSDGERPARPRRRKD